MAARLSRGVEHARLVLTRTLLERPSRMPLPHAYTSPCTVQLCRCVVNLASPFHQLNASCTAPHMHCTAPPLTLHPLAPVNVDVGAPSVTTSAYANCAGACGEVDVADDGTRAAGGVAASGWLAANLGGGVVDAGGTGARISTNDDAQSDDNEDDEASVLEVILGRQVGQREDTAYDEDGVDVSVGVDDDAVVGVDVH